MTETTENSGRDKETGRFTTGNPGRPKGTRHKLGEQFLKALQQDFEANGIEAITRVREKKPEVYMKVVADLLPKHVNLEVDPSEAFVKLWTAISDGLGEELADRITTEQGQSAPVCH